MEEEYKPGDIVTVEAVVAEQQGYLGLNVYFSGREMIVPRCLVRTHEPKPIRVGDKVMITPAQHPCSIYEVLCINENEAWIKPVNGGSCFTHYLNRLEHVS